MLYKTWFIFIKKKEGFTMKKLMRDYNSIVFNHHVVFNDF